MRSIVPVLAVSCLSGCVPGFEQFTIVDADGAVTTRDGGRSDAGVPACDQAVLACASSCEALFDSILAQADFETDTGDFTLRPVSGEAVLAGGHLVMSSPETWLLSLQQFGFGTVAACAEVELTFDAVQDDTGFLFGLRGPEHGTLLRMRPASGALQLATFEPAVTLVGAAPLAIPSGGASARYRVLSFVTDGYAHAEARRLDIEGIAAAHGPYGGARMPLEVELSFFAPDVATARVDRVVLGRPSAEILTTLEGL